MNIMTLARLPAAPAQLSYVVSIRSYAYVRYDTLSLTVFFRIPIVGFSPIHRYLAFGNLRESTTGDALDLRALFSTRPFANARAECSSNSLGDAKPNFREIERVDSRKIDSTCRKVETFSEQGRKASLHGNALTRAL